MDITAKSRPRPKYRLPLCPDRSINPTGHVAHVIDERQQAQPMSIFHQPMSILHGYIGNTVDEAIRLLLVKATKELDNYQSANK